MKKKLVLLFLAVVVTIGLYNIINVTTTQASSVATVNQIQITKNPDKMIYGYGESFNAAGMELIGQYSDGTSSAITDYTVEGFNSNQYGNQTVTIRYQGYAAYLYISVQPVKVTEIKISAASPDSYTLTWKPGAAETQYEIYRKDEMTGTNIFVTTVFNNTYTVSDYSGAVSTYQIRAKAMIDYIAYYGEYSDPFQATTAPGKVETLMVVGTTDSSVALSWNAVIGATGYSIYRKTGTATEYTYCGDAASFTYLDTKLKSGTAYQYKVYAYRLNNTILGESSPILDLSTNPAKVSLKCKTGDKKTRLTWSPVNGATSYEIFTGDEIQGYTLLETVAANGINSYIEENLITGVTYTYYMMAKRQYNGMVYEGTKSDVKTVTVGELPATSILPKYFADKTAFKNSMAYTTIPFFKENMIYNKSYVIPGIINTNVDGFQSTTMCPQSIIFAGNYLLISAYDISDEENSVIYCMDKSTRKLLTTLVLPTDAHVGGICYDGKSVYLTTGSKVSALWYSDITAAVATGEASVKVNFHSVCKVGFMASYITFYHDKLWVGSYNELKSTKLYSYEIDDFDTYVTLTRVDALTMPTRVQGIAFTNDGYMIMSRSCQLYKGLRGYMRRIDVYLPELSEEGTGNMDIGDCLNYVEVPSMNEGIAINGNYLYVIFESPAFENASYKVDRISAFDLKKILPQ
ncbi:MAG: hypothetical protein H6Q59_3251 [Firmicutes bacterium]|nr:hypothetical protein [Bacillota bacterium]